MSNGYSPFPISEFKTGTFTYLQKWVRPADAFEPLNNAYVYRGVISKRNGYSLFGSVADENPIMGIMQYIDESTGLPSLVVATTVNLYLWDIGSSTFGTVTSPPTFTGTINNFFNYTNWQASAGTTSYLYMVNGVDPITSFDGTTAAQPTLTVDGSGQEILTALDVKVYKNRLLVIQPTLSTDGFQAQAIYWSATSNPTNFLTDEAGNGGFLSAPTGDIIQSAEFLRDDLIVFFTNSTWVFRYTGNDFSPFRFDKINVSKNTNAPYGSVQYDEYVTSIGNTGLIACHGTVGVDRYDLNIIDYYETKFSEVYYAQSFSQRYDNLQQAWTLYVSQDNTFTKVDGIAPGSDKALIYNFLEKTWATYTFPIPMTCLGLFYNASGTTWADLTQSWEDTDFRWSDYYTQERSPILLGGDTTGHVWYMDNQAEVTDKEYVDGVLTDVDIILDVVSTRWNPIISSGQKVQFGYVDIYYQVVSVDPDNQIYVTLNFYVDNSNYVAASRTLTLDGPSENATSTIGTGTGAASYSGTISIGGGYIVPDTFNITTNTSAGVEDFNDDGNGALSGSLGDIGTINYNTGAWSITLLDTRTIDSDESIVANYKFNNPTSFNFKRIYVNLIGQFIQMEIDPTVNSYMQFNGFILWARPAGRLTGP